MGKHSLMKFGKGLFMFIHTCPISDSYLPIWSSEFVGNNQNDGDISEAITKDICDVP